MQILRAVTSTLWRGHIWTGPGCSPGIRVRIPPPRCLAIRCNRKLAIARGRASSWSLPCSVSEGL
eukprot:15447039-Alexandrium_andersonii.AAC.1